MTNLLETGVKHLVACVEVDAISVKPQVLRGQSERIARHAYVNVLHRRFDQPTASHARRHDVDATGCSRVAPVRAAFRANTNYRSADMDGQAVIDLRRRIAQAWLDKIGADFDVMHMRSRLVSDMAVCARKPNVRDRHAPSQ